MNLEELTKSQLILLTILVNFVTSIATGILTVSLLDVSPPFVTQTVNHVVEHTIETVTKTAPAAVITAPAPAPSNQDLVTAAIGADAARVVAIYGAKDGTSTPAVAIGTYLPKSRALATASLDSLPKEALVIFSNGVSAPASLVRADSGITIYGFADSATLPKVDSPDLIPAHSLKLGATALAITADGSAATGIISRVGDDGIRTTLPDIGTGSAVVDLSGNLIGVAAGGKAGLLIATDKILTLLTATSTATSTTTSSTSKPSY